MRRFRAFFPYLLIAIAFFAYLFIAHPQIFKYKFPRTLVHDYLRSQDIEDPLSLIHDRITLSDSDIYIASGYLYATGRNPVSYNFQHPPLVKYLFGLSTLLTGNPFYIQIFFGLSLLLLTYFLGLRLFRSRLVASGAVLLLLIDPVFGGMMNAALLDLGQAVFALGYVILMFFFPEAYILQGIVLGAFAASKFWSTAIIFALFIFGFKLLIQKEKLNIKKTILSLLLASVVFALTYTKSFIDAKGMFNIFAFLGRDARFMITHNSATSFFGPILLFITGFFAPWWEKGVIHAPDFSFLWPVGLISGLFLSLRNKLTDVKTFFFLLPFTYLLLESTQVPFTRYFIIILPFVYLSFANLILRCYHSIHDARKT